MLGKKLHIAHIDTEATWRGGEQQVFSLIRGLTDRGHSALAVVRKGGALQQKLQGEPVGVMPLRPLGEWDFIAAHFLNRKLKEEKVDIVHAHTAHGVALAALATLGTTIPIVVTRRVDFHLRPHFFSRWKYGRARKIIAISERVREVLLRDGILKEKLALVPSGIDPARFSNLSRASRADLQVGDEAIVIGQVAALAPHKDQVTFLKAVALIREKFRRVRAVIVGEGEERHRLEKLATELNITDIVRFLGFKEDPLRYLMAFDIFCLSSKEEGLGTSVLDAMALRIPVVATETGGIPELIEDGMTGYLTPPGNPEQLAAALTRAILNLGKEVTREICLRAFEKSRDWTISRTVNLTEEVYREVVAPIPPLAVQRGG